MVTIIAGCRDCTDSKILDAALLQCGWMPSKVVSGCAKGADTLGELWAKSQGVPIKRFPADWDKNGKAAGPLRNIEMACYAETLIALWDGKSKGTAHMIAEATKRKLKVYVHRY